MGALEQSLRRLAEKPPAFLALVLAPAVAGWWGLYLGCQEAGLQRFTAKAIASGLAFLAWPALSLRLTGRPLALGKLDSAFAQGLLLYGVIAAVLLAFYPANPGFFHDLVGSPRWFYLVKVAPVVMAVDFLTKRFIQKELAAAYGDNTGEAAQALVWFVGHALELIWLQPLLGLWGTVLFLAAAGLATGRLYRRTGNVAGMMAGHWMVSLLVVVVVDVI